MRRRGEGDQASFAEALLGPTAGSNAKLDGISEQINWAALAALVDRVRAGERGRPPYAPLAMLKALLLQTWYGLSDRELAEALCDRLSFRRFCGFALDEATPDDTTLCRYRAALGAAGVARAVFAEVNRQLDGRGLMLKQGTLIDATLVRADSAKQNRRADGTPVDPDARWLKYRGSVLGYKAHVAMDQHSALVRDAVLTPANVHDSRPAADLVQGDEAAVLADKAYDTRAFRAHLKAAGIADRLLHAGRNHKPLTAQQKAENWAIMQVRGGIEKLFGTWKRSWGYRRVRYRGLARNQVQLTLIAAAWNLMRAANIQKAQTA